MILINKFIKKKFLFFKKEKYQYIEKDCEICESKDHQVFQNIGKVLSVNFSDAMLWIGSKIPGIRSKSSTSLYRIVEDVCLMYQTTLNYKG